MDDPPVLDIKPYVPHYDSVAYNEYGDNVAGNEKDEVKILP